MAEEKEEKNASSASEEKTEKTTKVRPANTKTIPIMITLAAALIACILSIVQQVGLKEYVERLLFSVIIFGIIGIVIRVVLDRYFFRTKDIKEALEEKEDGEASSSEEDSDEDADE